MIGIITISILGLWILYQVYKLDRLTRPPTREARRRGVAPAKFHIPKCRISLERYLRLRFPLSLLGQRGQLCQIESLYIYINKIQEKQKRRLRENTRKTKFLFNWVAGEPPYIAEKFSSIIDISMRYRIFITIRILSPYAK